MKFVLAITGPTGAGKTTVAESVAKQLDHCVNIDADNIKHMIVSGFFDDPSMPGGGGFTEWELVGDSIGLLAKNFQDNGYDVIVNGYIDEPAWVNIQKYVTLTHKVLLLPHADAAIQRDAGRNEDIQMGSDAVLEHHEHFSNDEFFHDFVRLDTTNHSIEATVNEVLNLLTEDSKR